MRTWATVLASALALASPALTQDKPAELPSTDKVLEKYVESMGGKTAIEKVSSRVMKGSIEVATFGASGSFTQYAKAPNKLLNESVFEGYGSVLQGYDGTTAWMDTPDQGLRDMNEQEAMFFKRSADFTRTLHLKNEYKKLVVTGKAKVGQRDAYVVEGEPNQGGPEKMYFDVETGYMLRTEIQGPNNQPIVVTLEDYSDEGGVKAPHTIRQELPEMSLVIKFQKIEVNTPIEDAKFAKPAAK